MESEGYVARNDVTGKYSLGMRIVELAKTKLDQLDIRTLCRPFLEELVQKTQETAHLAIMDQGSIVYIDKVDTPHTLIMRSKIGLSNLPSLYSFGKSYSGCAGRSQNRCDLARGELTPLYSEYYH